MNVVVFSTIPSRIVTYKCQKQYFFINICWELPTPGVRKAMATLWRVGPPWARRSMNVATARTASRGSNGREQPEMNPLVRVRRQCSKEQRGCHIRPRLNDRIEILELVFYDVQVSSWHGRSELHEERAQMHLNG